MKKILFLFLSLSLVLGVLAACSKPDKTSSSGEKGDKTEEPVTIKFYTHGTEDGYAWDRTIKAFEEKNPTIKVDVVQLSEKQDSQEALKKIDLAAASGEEMDVVMFTNTANYAQRVNLGMLEPLDEMIKKDGFKMEDEYKVDTKINGKYYGLPGKYVSWFVLLNKDRLDAAGLEVPKSWTWDEYMEYAKKLTKDGKYGTYFHGPWQGAWANYMSLRLQSQEKDAGFLKTDGTSNIDSPLYKESLAMRVKMEKEDKSAVPYSSMISQKMNYRDQFFTQQVSMIITGTFMIAELGGSERFPADFNVAVAPFPQNKVDEKGAYSAADADILGVAANSKHKEAAYKFIRWYTTEGQIAQGINISSWKKTTDDQVIKLINDTLAEAQNPEKVDKESLIHSVQTTISAKVGKPVPYQSEIDLALSTEFEKLILGKQSLDETVASSKKVVQEIIDKNK
ncbi:sugar ABC transporter substrate-binding protein [Neobacillus sp. OS1-2]|uniref:ABC transporter substrate-binding protein n=1 Tax=Neobacillus sp. OS1-2 TaxID=3070680 RepID=UPI0027E06631|nr:sugar ABC transporter substrate-binding protein [Neobacillus sp. OS1-2]WML38567.1 sugar ABC transporter substrate-binding protein [Neobacillus sp. OS1-2]